MPSMTTTPPPCDAFRADARAYVDGELPPAERAAFEGHVATCAAWAPVHAARPPARRRGGGPGFGESVLGPGRRRDRAPRAGCGARVPRGARAPGPLPRGAHGDRGGRPRGRSRGPAPAAEGRQ